MSNLDGKDSNIDELNVLGKEMAPEEQAVEPAAEPAAEQPPKAEEVEEIETAELGELPAEGAKEGPAEAETAGERPAKGGKLPFPWEWGVGIAIPVVILALVLLQVLYFSTAIYLVSVGLVAFGVWRSRETNSAYTVLLACALVAILTAIYCLWAELGRYQFDLRAKQHSSLSTPIRAGLLTETGGPAINPRQPA